MAFSAADSAQPEQGALSRLVSPAAGSRSFSVPYESVDGGNYYYLISFGGSQQFFAKLWVYSNRTYGQLVSDANESRKLVAEYDSKRGASSAIPASLRNATSRMSNYTSGFASSQSECRRLMGLRNRNCTSFDTCQKACYAVTSFCLEIAQQFGKPFIYQLWQYENDTRDLLSLSASERLLAKEVSSAPTAQNMQSYAAVLGKMDVISTRMVTNNIFVKERYCDPPPLSLTAMRDARLGVASAITLTGEISGADSRAAQFAANAKKYSKSQYAIDLTSAANGGGNKNNSNSSAMPPVPNSSVNSGFVMPSIPNLGGSLLLPAGAFCASVAIIAIIAFMVFSKMGKGRI